MEDRGQLGGFRDWMRRVEVDLERMDDKWQKSVDDIKNTIRGEISDLKTEQIADMRRRIDEGYKTLEEYEERLRKTEATILEWNTGRGVVNWLIRVVFGAIGAVATILGYETLGRHH